jgi:uncharacterized protein (UPF0371 family)
VTLIKRRAAPVRYCARACTGSKIIELAIGENLARVIACARRHHRQTGQPAWVWRLKDGKSIFEIGGRPPSLLRAVLPAAPSHRIDA